jgi:hypothetical protein
VLFSALADCPICRVQGAVVETWDSQVPGTAIAARCRMCAREMEAGHETKPPMNLARLADVDAALSRWAKEEGFTSTAEFAQSAFVAGSLADVHAALILGDPVETSFDVMGFLFSHMGGGSPGVDASEPAPSQSKALVRKPAEALAALGERTFDPRNELLALAAAAAADGVVVDVERRFLDRYAADRGLDRLRADELRVYRADEVGPVGALLDRERVLERMVECAFVDGELDESEARVIKGYARAWGVDPQRVDKWFAAWADEGRTMFQKLLARAARHLFPEA